MNISKELKIGTFVITVLTVSFFVINYLRGKDLFNREIELCSQYDDVHGLVVSAPVYIKGYKAGKVISVDYDPASEGFKVACSVLKEIRIPEDSRMTIYSVDIMGGKGIRIDLGDSSSSVADGALLAPGVESDLIGELTSGIVPLIDKVGSTLDSLSLLISSVNRVFSEDNTSRISSTLSHLERTMSSLRSLSASVEGKSSDLELFIENMASLSVKLDSLAGSADSLIGGVSNTVASLNESDIKGLIGSLHALLDNINDPDGTIGKLLVDGSVYDSIDELLSDVDILVKKIQENPRKYIRISVF